MRCTHWSRQKDWSKVANAFLVVIEKEMCRFVQREEGEASKPPFTHMT